MQQVLVRVKPCPGLTSAWPWPNSAAAYFNPCIRNTFGMFELRKQVLHKIDTF